MYDIVISSSEHARQHVSFMCTPHPNTIILLVVYKNAILVRFVENLESIY